MVTGRRARSSAAIACALLILGASLCVQLSAAIAKGLLGTVGTVGVSGLRMAIAALVLLVLTRPALRGRPRREWAGIVLYGAAMAAMNVLFYNAVANLPLGIAVTLEFLGPFLVAFLGTRTRWESVFPLAALAGVALISDPTGSMTAVGLAWGLGAAVAFGGYTVLAGHVGRASSGFSGLALSVTVGALVLAPFSAAAVPRVSGTGGWPVLAASGIIGVAVAFGFTYTATRLTSPRVTGTLLAVDPAMGALIGALVLDERLTGPAGLGIALVVVSGAAVTWLAGARRGEPALRPDRSPGRPV
ncbi:EamA family transporter [Actinomadura scrupuli]|uniref:EamA family transporter n=1 Tax=Actinomadura scrupuli TaxID=559629 RepID=UPI003D96DB7B